MGLPRSREILSTPEITVTVNAAAPTRAEENIRYNVWHGVAANVAFNLASPFFGIFALKMGASNTQVALLSSAPAIVSLLAMIPGAIYVDSFAQKKRITTRFFVANRLFYLALACVPFFTPDRRAAALVAIVALMNLPGAIGNVAWQSFISRVIAPAQRAQAFARRNRWMNIIGTATVVVAGKALDVMAYPLGYQVVLVVAFVAALVEIRIFQRIDEPPAGPEVDHGAAPPGGAWRDILSHRLFIRYTLASVVFYFMWQLAWPLFTLYQVKVLGANNLWISLLTLANAGGAMFGYGFWATFADRHGHLRSLVVSTAGICLVPLYYAFSHSLLAITVLNMGTGVIFSGVNLALFNALLEHIPGRHTTRYIAYYNWATAVTTVLAPLAGVGLLSLLRNNYFWAFMACVVGRALGSACFYFEMKWEEREGRTAAGSAPAAPGEAAG